MSVITIFLILLVAVFATVLYFTEPSERRQANSAAAWPARVAWPGSKMTIRKFVKAGHL